MTTFGNLNSILGKFDITFDSHPYLLILAIKIHKVLKHVILILKGKNGKNEKLANTCSKISLLNDLFEKCRINFLKYINKNFL